MAIATSSTLETSRPMTRPEYVSTLPPWRRLLAMLNWRPVYDIEQQELASEKRMLESEKRIQESEKRLQQLKNETEQLRKENKRLAALNSRMDALLLSE